MADLTKAPEPERPFHLFTACSPFAHLCVPPVWVTSRPLIHMFTPTCLWFSDFWKNSALPTSAKPYLAKYLILKMNMFCCHSEPSCCAIGYTLVLHIARLGPAHCITLRTLGCTHCAPWVARIAHLDCASCAVCSAYVRSYVRFWFLEFQWFLHNLCLRTFGFW